MTGGQPTTFAQALKTYRRAAGLSQAALAERAHLSRDGVSALERGVSRAPRADTLDLLLSALRLTPTEQDQLLAAAHVGRLPPFRGSQRAPLLALPMPLTSIVGREQESDAVSQLLRREDVRLVTLTGAPGIGKTCLAIDVARKAVSAFPDGAVFVPLAPIREPSLVLSAIARAAHLRDLSEPMSKGLAAELGACTLLLVLDGFERVLGAAPALADVLGACPHVKALVTSRATLRIRGEHEFSVAPLLPPDATELFVRRAAAAQPEFALTPQNAPAIAEIMRQMDGLPLAIELAAARIKLLPPKTLLERLTPALPLLTRGGQDLPERQHTMRRAIAWSYELLDLSMQRFFRRLAIFAGGWTLEAAERVCGAADNDTGPALDALAALMDQSLVLRLAADSSAPRFRLLATLREFGLEQLEVSGEAEMMACRHARYYMELAEAWDADAEERRAAPPLSVLEDERNNLYAALRWALSRADLEIAGRLVGALARFWSQTGYVEEGRAWLSETRDAFRSANGDARVPALAEAQAKMARGVALLAVSHPVVDMAASLAGESVEFAHGAGDGLRLA